jgi:hypothetical protein
VEDERSSQCDSGYSSRSSSRSGEYGDEFDYEDLPNCGLIFIATEDAPSLVTSAITKQPFSTIGFFYKTSMSGKLEVNIVLVDVYRFTIPDWLGNGASLRDLINNDLVSKISIKGLSAIRDEDGEIDENATECLCTEFRQAIAQVVGNGTETSLTEIICQLFGHKIDKPTSGVTPVEMVNRVIATIGKSDAIKPDGSLSASAMRALEGPDVLGSDISSKGRMMQILAANFNQQEVNDPSVANKLMQSYIVENDLFDDLIDIPLPERDPHKLRERQEVTLMLQSNYMERAVEQFVQMLVTDQGFYETVVSGFNQTRMISQSKETDYRKSILALADDSEELGRLLVKWINSGEVQYTKLLSLLSKVDDTKDMISYRHDICIGDRIKLPLVDSSKLLLLRKDVDTRHDSRYLVGAYMALRGQFNDILRDINTGAGGRDPVIDINAMVKNMNDMAIAMGICTHPLVPIEGECSYRAIINVTSVPPTRVPLVLKSGECVSLPLFNADLAQFDRCTLEEILETLDTHSTADYRFNTLRRDITARLAMFAE